ncbi:hypothetical protein J2W57_001799 [Chryseobacterium ginsenosidimutans]|uniref:NADH dehydrogenase subunit 6 n=1 Tax=Chryseobacterium geocarposphaerae TaxID=1416776 RepID=A0ABU1LBG2_9FLAO|nr:hypothetical protein [Chryseobacterium geocarposphaerae]MDR6698427.1 hypothetical protein [Chryseobacterium ginsenosidimutans]
MYFFYMILIFFLVIVIYFSVVLIFFIYTIIQNSLFPIVFLIAAM